MRGFPPFAFSRPMMHVLNNQHGEFMKIKKLIEKLQELDAKYPGYDVLSPNAERGEYTGNLIATIHTGEHMIELEGAYDLEDTLTEWDSEVYEEQEAD